MPNHAGKSTNDARPMSLLRRFDTVMGRVGRISLLISFVAGLIWATASGEDYPLVLVLPLVTILAGRLVGAWLGGFVGQVVKYATGFMLAWLLVTALLFYTRLDELPKILRNGESAGALLRPLRAVYLTDTWSLSLLVGFIGATACEFGLALLAVVTLCVRRALRISLPSLPPSNRRRWYQISLKTALLLALTFTVGMGWFATRSNRARTNRDRVANVDDTVAAIEKLGGRVDSSRVDARDSTWLEQLFDDPGNPDDPTVAIKGHAVWLTNLDALELASELSDLQLLQIEKSNLTDKHLQQIGGMTGLKWLELSDLQVEHLGALSSIQKLELSNIRIEGPGPEHLPGLKKLTELTLGETTGFFEHAGDLPSLRAITLNLSGVDTTLKHLRRLTTLQEVDLSFSDVTNDQLRHLKTMPNLVALTLDYTAISDEGLVHISEMKQLVSLSLSRTKITDRGLAALRELDQLTRLDLSVTDIGDAGVKQLRGLTQLEELNLGVTQITSASLQYVEEMSNLSELGIRKTKVDDAGLKHLVGLINLSELSVGQTNVTDAGLKHLVGLTNLSELWLDQTAVTDAGEAELKEALPNCVIRR